ncbi:MAG: BON domain-containing protein [Desulfobacterales bacterium]|nr:BON domain-containing protein [Desulfobacterales bacterium]
MNNDRIESSARQSYVFKTYLNGDDIKITSKDGAVILTGSVSDEAHKSLAEETVASLPGVTSVDNNLEIKGEVPAVHSNAWIITKVKATLLFNRNVRAMKTEVFVEDGTVTLRGEATSNAQKDLTTEYVKDVEGVRDVINEMTLLIDVMKPDEKTMDEKIDTIIESIDDSSITAMVKMTLMYHRSTSALNTTVKTKEGVVTLGGNIKNDAEKSLATQIVSDVHGVKNVINNMTNAQDQLRLGFRHTLESEGLESEGQEKN